MHPYKNFGISWAHLQNKTTIGVNFKVKKNQMNKNKRLRKQNFLTNLQDQLSANSKKPRIPQRFLFYSTPNQASQYLKSLVNFQQCKKGFFFRNFQLSKKFVFCLRITRRFKVFLLLNNG